MIKHRASSLFEQLDESSEPFWEVVVAWVLVGLLVVGTSIGLLLDQIATLSP
jgi:F0F1-type ATP synthase assembly protein I